RLLLHSETHDNGQITVPALCRSFEPRKSSTPLLEQQLKTEYRLACSVPEQLVVVGPPPHECDQRSRRAIQNRIQLEQMRALHLIGSRVVEHVHGLQSEPEAAQSEHVESEICCKPQAVRMSLPRLPERKVSHRV